MRQSARAKSAIRELSWAARGRHQPLAAGSPGRRRPHVMLPRAVGLERLAQDRLVRPPRALAKPEQAVQHRHQEHEPADQRRRRGCPARQAPAGCQAGHRGGACQAAWRSSRSRAPCPSERSAALTRSRSPTEAPPTVTRMSAALPVRASVTRLSGCVLRDAEAHRLAALRLDQRGKAGGNGGDDLIPVERGAGRHHLIAGGKDRDLRLAADGKLGMVHGGGEHQLARAEPCPGAKQHLAFA